MAKQPDQSLTTQERVQLAVDGYQKGQFKSIRQAARLYNVSDTTVAGRLRGRLPPSTAQMANRKLTPAQERSLVQWILSMDERGMAPTIDYTRRMADLLLSERTGSTETVGACWVRRFVERYDELTAKYSRRYDYQRAKCEDPSVIQQWFQRVAEAVEKYGIVADDIYNFDETGFQMGVARTAKVLTRSDRRGRPMVAQPGNREWVTVIEAVNCTGWALPAKIIFQGKIHQEAWYQCSIPTDWVIGVSDKGWTTDDHGLHWLREIFEPVTRRRAVGQYRLLILDGHGSHVTPAFDQYCQDHSIVVLQMPAHSSHLLQPLDVGCFSPLKTIYGSLVQQKVLGGVHHIDKVDFLTLYIQARARALSASNIRGGFAGAGLQPLDPDRVLRRLQIRVDGLVDSSVAGPVACRTPSPLRSPQPSKTPYNLRELRSHASQLHQRRPPQNSPVSQAIGQLVKGYEVALNNAVLLAEEIRLLREENQRRRQKKEQRRRQLATGGNLTGGEGLARIEQLDAQAIGPSNRSSTTLATESSTRSGARPEAEPSTTPASQGNTSGQNRRRAPPKCSICGTVGHTARVCKSR